MINDKLPEISEKELPALIDGARQATSSGLDGFIRRVLGLGAADQATLEQSPPNDAVDNQPSRS
jgi:hypothetical protein